VDIVVARRGNLGRNRNVSTQATAFAHVRHAEPPELDDSVNQLRTPEGGLLFTNESPAADGAP
jgi:hypothetical protein